MCYYFIRLFICYIYNHIPLSLFKVYRACIMLMPNVQGTSDVIGRHNMLCLTFTACVGLTFNPFSACLFVVYLTTPFSVTQIIQRRMKG
jgi:hypothetical protein